MSEDESEKAQSYAKAILISSIAAQIRIYANLYFIDEVIVPSLASAFMKEAEKRLGKEKLKEMISNMIGAVDLIDEENKEESSAP